MLKENLSLIFGVIVVFGILALAMYASKRLSSATLFNRKSKYMQTIDRIMLSKDQWIELIKISDQIYIIGVSPNGMQTLAIVSETDLTENVLDQNMESFKSMFERILKQKNGNNN